MRVRFQLYFQALSQPIHKIEVSSQLADIQNRTVIQTGISESRDLRSKAFLRMKR